MFNAAFVSSPDEGRNRFTLRKTPVFLPIMAEWMQM